MLGICYSLTLQSGFMKDCLTGFVTIIRGCALITERTISRGSSSTAFCLDPTSHVQSMLQELRDVPFLRPAFLQEGVQSRKAFGDTLTKNSHRRFHHALLQTLTGIQRSAV